MDRDGWMTNEQEDNELMDDKERNNKSHPSLKRIKKEGIYADNQDCFFLNKFIHLYMAFIFLT